MAVWRGQDRLNFTDHRSWRVLWHCDAQGQPPAGQRLAVNSRRDLTHTIKCLSPFLLRFYRMWWSQLLWHYALTHILILHALHIALDDLPASLMR